MKNIQYLISSLLTFLLVASLQGQTDGGTNFHSVSSTTVQPLGTITVEHLIQNLDNTQGTGDYTVTYFLTADAFDLNNNNVDLGAIASDNQIVAGGEIEFNSGELTIPGGTEPGEYFLVWTLNSGLTNQTVFFNGGQTLITVAGIGTDSDLADAGADQQTISTTTIEPGGSLNVTHGINNTGFNPSGAVTVEYFLSLDGGISAAQDISIGSVALPSIGPGESVTVASGDLSIPVDIDTGNYVLAWIITSDFGATTVILNNGGTQLTLGDSDSPIDIADDGGENQSINRTQINVGEPVLDVFSVLTNNGTLPSGSFTVDLVLSSDVFIDVADDLLAQIQIDNINPGQQVPLNFIDVEVPLGFTQGNYFVGWRIDSSAAVNESNEANNNILLNGGLTQLSVVGQSGRAELIDAGEGVHILSGEDTAFFTDETITVTHDVTNTGLIPSGPFSIRYVFSSDTEIGNEDFEIRTINVDSIVPGGTVNVGLIDSLIPNTIPTGVYTLGWIIDFNNTVPEPGDDPDADNFNSDVNNFIQFRSADTQFTVTNPRAFIELENGGSDFHFVEVFDFVTGESTTSDDTDLIATFAGETISVTGSIRNTGNTPSGPLEVRLLVGNATLGIVPIDNVLPELTGQEIPEPTTFNVTATLPDTTGSNITNIRYTIDISNDVFEENEYNNNVTLLDNQFRLNILPRQQNVNLRNFGDEHHFIRSTSGRGEGRLIYGHGEGFEIGGISANDGVWTTDPNFPRSRTVVGVPVIPYNAQIYLSLDRELSNDDQLIGNLGNIGVSDVGLAREPFRSQPDGQTLADFIGGNLPPVPNNPAFLSNNFNSPIIPFSTTFTPRITNTPPGTYFVIFFVDSADEVDESARSETDNIFLFQGGTQIEIVNAGTNIDLEDPLVDVLANREITGATTPIAEAHTIRLTGGSQIDLNTTSSIDVSIGQSLDVTHFIINDGGSVINPFEEALGAFTVNYYLSTDTDINPNEDFLVRSDLFEQTVEGDELLERNISITIPPGIQPGSYTLGWVLDDGNIVNEVNEMDNEILFNFSEEFRVNVLSSGAAFADLQDAGINLQTVSSRIASAGSPFSFSHGVTNRGETANVVTEVAYYFSLDSTVDEEDILIGTAPLGSLAPGETVTVGLTDVILPFEIANGQYNLIWSIDPENLVLERNETDNIILFSGGNQTIAVDVEIGNVDLADIDPTSHLLNGVPFTADAPIPTIMTEFDTFTFQTDISNLGTDPSGDFDVDLYISDNTLLNAPLPDDVFLGTVRVSSLAGGERRTVVFEDLVIPDEVDAGIQFLGWFIDPRDNFTGLDEVNEVDEANNIAILGNGFSQFLSTSDIDLAPTGIVTSTASQLSPFNLFSNNASSLEGTSITFFPDGVNGYSTINSANPVRNNNGVFTVLNGSNVDDTVISVPINNGQTFPFYGADIDTVFVDTNGRILLANGINSDFTQSIGEHLATPQIALFWSDINPGVSGDILVSQQPDRLVFIYDSIPEFGNNLELVTAQVELFFDGRVVFSYFDVDIDEALVGISPGGLVFDPNNNGIGGVVPPTNFVNINDPIDITVDIINTGVNNAVDFDVDFFFVNNGNVGGSLFSGAFLGTTRVDRLDAGQILTVTLENARVPSDATLGLQRVAINVDSGAEVVETNENNNSSLLLDDSFLYSVDYEINLECERTVLPNGEPVFLLSWLSRPNETYSVFTSTDLTDPLGFTPVQFENPDPGVFQGITPIIEGTGNVIQVTLPDNYELFNGVFTFDLSPVEGRRFFRVFEN